MSLLNNTSYTSCWLFWLEPAQAIKQAVNARESPTSFKVIETHATLLLLDQEKEREFYICCDCMYMSCALVLSLFIGVN